VEAERAAPEAKTAVGKRGVDMDMKVHAGAETLDRVELRRGRAFRSVRSFSIKSCQRPRQNRVDLAAKARVAMDKVAQALGQDKHPLAVRDIR
jgi:hypothetical protein